MKELNLCTTPLEEETLIVYKNHKFLVANRSCGQYGYERRVIILLIKDDLTKEKFKDVGVIRLFAREHIEQESIATQCLVKGTTTFKDCLFASKEYINKYVNFII